MSVFRLLLVSLAACIALPVCADHPTDLDHLLSQVREASSREAVVRKQREQRFLCRAVGDFAFGEDAGPEHPRFTAMPEGIKMGRQQVRLDMPIKMLGIHDVAVALHPEVEVMVHVNVARSQEEADIQAGKAAPRGVRRRC